MKKLFVSLFILTVVTLFATAQSNTPRFFKERGALANGSDLNFRYYAITDAAGTDTIRLDPDSWRTHYSINNGDTLNRRVCIKIGDETYNGVTYSRAGSYKYDEVTFHYKTGGGQVDTIDFAGNMIVDTAGTGTNKVFIPKSTLKKSYFIRFIFDGTNWVQETIFK